MAHEGGEIVETMDIDLPRPRTIEMMASERFQEIKAQAIEILYRDETDEVELEIISR